MSINSKIQNIIIASKRLKNKKWKRVREIIQIYGVRELFRRIRLKANDGSAAFGTSQKAYITINESFYPSKKWKEFRRESEVVFTTKPNAPNIGRLEIATECKSLKDAKMTLRILYQGKLLASCETSKIADGGYTSFNFLPLHHVLHLPLTFELHSYGECGFLVNSKKVKHGFEVNGGGSIICRLYSRSDAQYATWMGLHDPTTKELERQETYVFLRQPMFSIVVPLYNTPERLFAEMVDSVIAQTYKHWELCLADGSTKPNQLEKLVSQYNDKRIKYKKLEQNKGISGNSNEAIKMAKGDYIALLDHDDTIMPQALFRYTELINQDEDYELIYSDEDKLTEDGTHRFDPFFKPEFSPNTLYSFNYITHFSVFKKRLLDEIGYFRDEFNGAQDYDLILRASENAKKIGHIPEILYNWRLSETSTAYSSDTKSYTVSAGKAAIEASLKRRNIQAEVKTAKLANYYNVVYPIMQPQPKISIIIPNKDEKRMLKRCIDSIINKTTYKNYEIIIIENNSQKKNTFDYYEDLKKKSFIRVIEWNHAFNYSAINNFAVKHAKGELLVFLNNDTSIISSDWLEQMAMHALRKEIGAVGAMLYYPDDTVQHAGVVLRIGGIAGHSHKGTDRGEPGSFARLFVVHDVSAVTAACLMTRRAVFEEVGGFNEALAVAFNDIDFCLKIREKEYQIVMNPLAELYHYESKTRGYESSDERVQRFLIESERWLETWHKTYKTDPFYSPNLTYIYQDYTINLDDQAWQVGISEKMDDSQKGVYALLEKMDDNKKGE